MLSETVRHFQLISAPSASFLHLSCFKCFSLNVDISLANIWHWILPPDDCLWTRGRSFSVFRLDSKHFLFICVFKTISKSGWKLVSSDQSHKNFLLSTDAPQAWLSVHHSNTLACSYHPPLHLHQLRSWFMETTLSTWSTVQPWPTAER